MITKEEQDYIKECSIEEEVIERVEWFTLGITGSFLIALIIYGAMS